MSLRGGRVQRKPEDRSSVDDASAAWRNRQSAAVTGEIGANDAEEKVRTEPTLTAKQIGLALWRKRKKGGDMHMRRKSVESDWHVVAIQLRPVVTLTVLSFFNLTI